MHLEPTQQPIISRGWIRVGIFLILLIALNLFAGFILATTIPSGAEADDNNELEQLLYPSIIASVIISLITVILCRKLLDKQSVKSLGLAFRGFRNDALTGLFLAISILGTGALILVLNKNLQWIDIGLELLPILNSLLLMAFIAISEELVFRGYILNNLMQSFNRWIALLISSLIFAVFHLQNPEISFIPILNLVCSGILLGLNYLYTKNLWYSILFHFAWNFFQGPILGLPVSGFSFESILTADLQGNELLTGGGFGFEGSILEAVLCIIFTLILFMVYEKRFHRKASDEDLVVAKIK